MRRALVRMRGDVMAAAGGPWGALGKALSVQGTLAWDMGPGEFVWGAEVRQVTVRFRSLDGWLLK